MTNFKGNYRGTRARPTDLVGCGDLGQGLWIVYREKITLATQTTSDTITVAYPRQGEQFGFGNLISDTSLATSTVAIGITGTTGKYRAAATFTVSTFVATAFGAPSAVTAFDVLRALETVFWTIGTASLPASGTVFCDMYYYPSGMEENPPQHDMLRRST